MTIKTEDLQAIETMVSQAGRDAPLYQALREKFPHLSWSRCESSDVLEEPFRSFEAFDLHLLDVSNHCPVVVSDIAAANGFILASRSGS